MNVRQLMERLAACNPDAIVIVNHLVRYSSYTWADETTEIVDLMPWPEPAATADKIELVKCD